MRISDWSSDVCSSDLFAPRSRTRCLDRAAGGRIMTITPEEIAAFADGQMEGDAKARVAAAVAADPQLARQVEAHRALAARLAGHFAPILEIGSASCRERVCQYA